MAATINSVTDALFEIYIHHRKCVGQSLMICKHCTASHLVELSLHKNDSGFEVWCFETGKFENTVSLLALTEDNVDMQNNVDTAVSCNV